MWGLVHVVYVTIVVIQSCCKLSSALTDITQHFMVSDTSTEGVWKINGIVNDGSNEITKSLFVTRAAIPRQFHKNHSCYRVNFDNNRTTFCYPLVTIGGVAKCGTSSIYKLFSSNRKTFVPRRKEECNRLFFRLKDNVLVRLVLCTLSFTVT